MGQRPVFSEHSQHMDKWLHGSRHASLGIRKQTRHRESSECSTATRLCMARYAPSVRSISTSSPRIGSAAIAVWSPRASASCCFNCASCCSQPGAEKGRGSLVKLEAGVREGSEQDGETASREVRRRRNEERRQRGGLQVRTGRRRRREGKVSQERQGKVSHNAHPTAEERKGGVACVDDARARTRTRSSRLSPRASTGSGRRDAGADGVDDDICSILARRRIRKAGSATCYFVILLFCR